MIKKTPNLVDNDNKTDVDQNSFMNFWNLNVCMAVSDMSLFEIASSGLHYE